jgi:ABC-type Fe3+ transport system permease subunit
VKAVLILVPLGITLVLMVFVDFMALRGYWRGDLNISEKGSVEHSRETHRIRVALVAVIGFCVVVSALIVIAVLLSG